MKSFGTIARKIPYIPGMRDRALPKFLAVAGAACLLAAACAFFTPYEPSPPVVAAATVSAPAYAANGDMLPPTNYREWIYLSSGVDMSYTANPANMTMFDNVFVNPEAYRSFVATGTWPDKTVLVLEVREAIDYLRNVNVDPRLHEVTVDLTAELLVLGKLAGDKRQAVDKVQKMLLSGKAAEHFAKMVKSLGGPSDLLEKPEKYLKTAPVVRDFHPDREIFLGAMNVFDIGIGIVELGGGRMRTTDVIDHSVGLSNMAQLEETVGPHGRPLATIHARSESDWQRMAQTLTEAVSPLSPSERRPTSRPVVLSL